MLIPVIKSHILIYVLIGCKKDVCLCVLGNDGLILSLNDLFPYYLSSPNLLALSLTPRDNIQCIVYLYFKLLFVLFEAIKMALQLPTE